MFPVWSHISRLLLKIPAGSVLRSNNLLQQFTVHLSIWWHGCISRLEPLSRSKRRVCNCAHPRFRICFHALAHYIISRILTRTRATAPLAQDISSLCILILTHCKEHHIKVTPRNHERNCCFNVVANIHRQYHLQQEFSFSQYAQSKDSWSALLTWGRTFTMHSSLIKCWIPSDSWVSLAFVTSCNTTTMSWSTANHDSPSSSKWLGSAAKESTYMGTTCVPRERLLFLSMLACIHKRKMALLARHFAQSELAAENLKIPKL